MSRKVIIWLFVLTSLFAVFYALNKAGLFELDIFGFVRHDNDTRTGISGGGNEAGNPSDDRLGQELDLERSRSVDAPNNLQPDEIIVRGNGSNNSSVGNDAVVASQNNEPRSIPSARSLNELPPKPDWSRVSDWLIERNRRLNPYSMEPIYVSPISGDELRKYFKPEKDFLEQESANFEESRSINIVVNELLQLYSSGLNSEARLSSSDFEYYSRWAHRAIYGFLSASPSSVFVHPWNDREISYLYDIVSDRFHPQVEDLFRKQLQAGILLKADENESQKRNLGNIVIERSLSSLIDQDALVEYSYFSSLHNYDYDEYSWYLPWLYFQIGQAEDPYYAPVLIDALERCRLIIENESLLERVINMPTTRGRVFMGVLLSASAALVRILGYSFPTLEENAKSENWKKLIENVSKENNVPDNSIENYREALLTIPRVENGFLQYSLSAFPFIPPDNEAPQFVFCDNIFIRSQPAINFSTDISIATILLSQFGTDIASDLISVLSESRASVSEYEKRIINSALISINDGRFGSHLASEIRERHFDFEEQLTNFIEFHSLAQTKNLARFNWSHLYPAIGESDFLSALLASMATRNEAASEGISSRLDTEENSRCRMFLMLMLGFMKPDEFYVPELIDILSSDEYTEKIRSIAIWALVLNSGHTFGSPEADNDPTAWQNWWSTPPDQRVR
ncbi:MAG: hypothetical protein NUW37_13015 [Planctomycetes bacterium]|nr:hypothetical protein [Planctomycetota bacterium]